MAKRVTKEEKAEIRRLHAEGLSYTAIGKEIGRSDRAVRYWIIPGNKEQRSQHMQEYYATHRDEIQQRRQKYYVAHREEMKQRAREYRMEHKEEIAERERKRSVARREEKAQYMRKYYVTHREERSKYSKVYNAAHRKERRQYNQEYQATYREEIAQKGKEYRVAHQGNLIKYHRKYYAAHREEARKYKQKYYAAHREEARKYKRDKYRNNIEFKLGMRLRSALATAIKNGQKAGSAVHDLGCTIPELKVYLESQFQPGMTWDNWSYDGWHIDHIRPLTSFDLTDRAQLKEACHYTNLQPLWAKENLSKGAKTLEEYRQYQLEAVTA